MAYDANAVTRILNSLKSQGVRPYDAIQQLINAGVPEQDALVAVGRAIGGMPRGGITPETTNPYAGPTAPAGPPNTMIDVITKYQAGGYGSVGSPEARKQAIVDLAGVWADTGLSQDAAFARATTQFDQIVKSAGAVPGSTSGGDGTAGGPGVASGSAGAGGPGVASGSAGAVGTGGGYSGVPGRPGAGGPTVPVMGGDAALTNEEFEAQQSETEAGRANLFKRYLANRLPEGSPGLLRSALARRLPGLSNAFATGVGFGDVPQGQGFTDYLRNRLEGGVSPAEQQATLDRARGLLAGSTTGLTPNQQSFRQDLLGDPRQQFRLAQEAGRSGVARPFEDTYEDLAARNFQAYQLQSGLGHLGLGRRNQSYLDFANREGVLGQTGADQFRNLASHAGDLLANPDAGLAPELQTFRSGLLKNPEEQFALALQAAQEDIAAPFQQGYAGIARRAFDRYPVGAGIDNPFLSYIARRGFRF